MWRSLLDAPDCPSRWRSLGAAWVTTRRRANVMDMLIAGPALIAGGILASKLPRLLRHWLVAGGVLLIGYNAADMVFDEEVDVPSR